MFRSALAALVLIVFGVGPALAAERPDVYRVRSGDSLASIASKEHVPTAALARLNRLDPAAPHLVPGTLIALDGPAAAASRATDLASSAEARRILAGLLAGSRVPRTDAELAMWSQPGDSIHRLAARIASRTSTMVRAITKTAMRFIGVPYAFGGTSSAGFDCSGYVQHVFAMLGYRLPRTADAQFYSAKPARGGVRPGDLVFFQTYAPGPSHVGIYLGHGKFIDASSSHGVTISRLSDPYWSARYLGAKRILVAHT